MFPTPPPPPRSRKEVPWGPPHGSIAARPGALLRTRVLLSALLGAAAAAPSPGHASAPVPAPTRSQAPEGSPVPTAARVLTGQVVDAATGTPVEGALVLLERPVRSAVTGRDGRFRLAPVPPAPLRLRVEAPGFRARTVEVQAIPEIDSPPLRQGDRAVRGGREEVPSVFLVVALDPEPLPLDGVTVSASPLRGTAVYQPATAFDGEALQRRMGTSLGETLDGSPGVAMRSMGPAPARPVIRGLDGDRVLVLQDGERTGDLSETAPDHAITLDPLSAERVEVVRGPASLLYGGSALGGVVNVLGRDIPRGWSPGLSGRGSAHLASVNRMAAVSAEVARGEEAWAVSLRGSARETGDVGTPAGTLPGTFSRSRSAAAGVGFRAGASRGGVALSTMRHDYGLPEGPDEDVRIHMERTALQARLTTGGRGPVESTELRIHAARYAHDEVEREVDEAGVRVGTLGLSYEQRSVSATFTARHGAWGPVAQGALGASLHHRTLSVGGEEALTPDATGSFGGAFAFQEVPLPLAGLRLQAGIRAERQRTRARPNAHFGPPFPGAPWAPGVSRTAWIVSGALGVAARPADGWEVGAQAARAHRAPTPEERWSDAPHLGTGAYEIGDPSLGNEVGHGLDLFARRGGRRVRGEVALFANRIDGFIHMVPEGRVDPTSGFPVVRYVAGDALLLGGEVWVEAEPTPTLTLRGSADLVRGSRRGDGGSPLPFMPPARIRVQLTRDTGAWWAGGSVRAAARQDRIAPEEEETPGYALLAAEAGIRLDDRGRHALVLRADNLLNRTWRDHLSRIENRGHPMPGRNLAVVYRVGW